MMFYNLENKPTIVVESMATEVPAKEFKIICGVTGKPVQSIVFHSGPMSSGVNGVLMEDLLKCILLRLNEFQQGPYACSENAEAMAHIEKAMGALDTRTARMTGSTKT